MRITLNLATRPFTDIGPAIKRLRITMGVLAGVSLLLLLGLHALHRKAEEARQRDHSLDGALAKITSERQGYQAMMQRPENVRFMEQVGTLNQLFDEKGFSWTMAMENLETVLPGGVQVTVIEPARTKTGQITLHLRVSGPHNLADDLVRNLERSRRFASPRIVGENAQSSNGPGGPNRQLEPVSESNQFEFDVQTEYVPPTPEERAAQKKAAQAEAAKKETPGGDESDSGNGNRPGAARRVPGMGRPMQRPPYTGESGPDKPRPGASRLSAPAQGGPQ
jgi:type IV pilus assembly protein PilN